MYSVKSIQRGPHCVANGRNIADQPPLHHQMYSALNKVSEVYRHTDTLAYMNHHVWHKPDRAHEVVR